MRRLLHLLVLIALITLIVFALAGVAVAQTGQAATIPDLFDKAQVIALLGGVVLPFVVALLTKAYATGLVKSIVALICAGLVALATYLTNTGGATTWRGALSVFVVTIVAAAGSRVTITGGADTALANKTSSFGVG